MTKAKNTRTKRRESRKTARQEEIHTRLYSAEHLGSLLERQGLLRSDNAREQPWCFHLRNPYGNLVCVFDSHDASRMILEILKDIIYPEIDEMMNAGDAEARDPNEIGMEILMRRQEVWMKYYFESYVLLHKHFEHVFKDAIMRLVEEVVEVMVPELEGQGGFTFTERKRKDVRRFHHYSNVLDKKWLAPEERRARRIRILKAGRPTNRLRRPKGSGWFRSSAEFQVALREILDLSSGKPPERWVVEKLRSHRLRQHPERRGTLNGQKRTLQRWLRDAGLVDLKAAVEWNKTLKHLENELAAQVMIRRKSGREPVTSLTVSHRAIDPATGKKEMFTRSVQRYFDPSENEFEVDGPTARAALATGAFELAPIRQPSATNNLGK